MDQTGSPAEYSATSIPPRRRRRQRRDRLVGSRSTSSGLRPEARADLSDLEPLRPRRRRRAAQAGGGLRQGQRRHGARRHHGAPADAGQDRGRGPVPVGARHVPDRERRPVPLREPPRPDGRPGREAGQAGRRLVSVRGGELPDQVGLEGDSVVLGLLSGHLQHGPLQEGRIRASPENLGRAPEDGQGAQEAGQPGRHRHQPLLRRELDLLVGLVVARGQGARGGRQDAGDQLGEDRADHRVVQGALQGRDGARGAVLGRRGQQPLPPLRQGLVDPQPGQPLHSALANKQPIADDINHHNSPAGRAGTTAPPPRASASGSSPRTSSWPRSSSPYLFQKQNFDAWIVASNAFNHPRSRTSPTIRSGHGTRSSRCCPRRPSTPTRAGGRPSRTRRCSGSTTTTSWPTWSPRRSTVRRPSAPWTGPRSRSRSR